MGFGKKKNHLGVDYDGFKAESRGDASIWCLEVKLQRSMFFNIKLLTEDVAHTLAVEWCAKMQHMYDAHLSAPDEKTLFDIIASFEESEQFALLSRGCSAVAQSKIDHIRGLTAGFVG